MLDPFTALSVASSVIQIVDFSSKLVSKGEEIRRNGSLVENDELERVTKDLQELNGSLLGWLHPDPPLIGCLTKDQSVSVSLVHLSFSSLD